MNMLFQDLKTGQVEREDKSDRDIEDSGTYMKEENWKIPNHGNKENYDFHIVGNKFLSLINEESHHSKWNSGSWQEKVLLENALCC